MKPHYVFVAALATASLAAIAAAPDKLPAPWVITGPSVDKFSAGIDQSVVDGVRGAKFLLNTSGDAGAWGALAQQVSAQNYSGQRLRFRARVRTEDVTTYAGLWMRVDSPTRHGVAFYNSSDKPIKGSTGWQERSVTLDVAPDASVITFGVINSGKGQVWIDALALETVGQDIPVDNMPQRALPTTPSL